MKHADILKRIDAIQGGDGRRIVAIAGAPASGKSTFAAHLSACRAGAVVVPMDGFHRSNADLHAAGLFARKGAPETFDTEAFVGFVRALRTAESVSYPTFDRATDSVVPNGGHVHQQANTILVEGNYLLLDKAPWTSLRNVWDLSIMLDVAIADLEERLIARWCRYGFDVEAARLRAQNNDIPNARLVQSHSFGADITLTGAEF